MSRPWLVPSLFPFSSGAGSGGGGGFGSLRHPSFLFPTRLAFLHVVRFLFPPLTFRRSCWRPCWSVVDEHACASTGGVGWAAHTQHE